MSFLCLCSVYVGSKLQAYSQPSDSGGRFPLILDLFQGLKIGVPSGCVGETSIFKIIMIDDVTLWSELEIHGKSTPMLALEQLAEK